MFLVHYGISDHLCYDLTYANQTKANMTLSKSLLPSDEMPKNQAPKRDFVELSLAIACTRGREIFVERFRHILHREGFTEAQWRVLRILFDLGQLTSVEIAGQACIHKVSISRITATLEKQGLVVRIASSSDGRASFVALSDTGKARMAPLVTEAIVIRKQFTKEFGRERYEQLMQLLQDLAKLRQ